MKRSSWWTYVVTVVLSLFVAYLFALGLYNVQPGWWGQ